MTSYDPALMKSVEKLDYRVTVGDVAAQSGLSLEVAQQGLLALASDAQGHLQVADSGDIVYLFPPNFRGILRNKYFRLRLQAWLEKAWSVIFYLIRISFGIILVASILLMVIAIVVIIISLNSSRDDKSGGGQSNSNSGGGVMMLPPNLIGNLFWIFSPNYYEPRPSQYRPSQPRQKKDNQLNFLEAIYSFLFGDGNPNSDLEEQRWYNIGAVIQENKGVIAAEQIAPYWDNISTIEQENEDYVLPVLTKFNGYPKVSDQGQIVYYFPELQVTAQKRNIHPFSDYLAENPWRFSQASSAQIMLAIGLGGLNFILALMLGSFLQEYTVSGGFLTFVQGIYTVLLGYAIAFLSLPLIRYFWVQWRNGIIASRNQKRQLRAEKLTLPNAEREAKLDYARQFAAEKVIKGEDITYSTEKDALTQEIEQSEQIDQEWRRRLEES
ncbi:MAG: hypothetical protein AB4058_13170 [Microcystaceae cyanobacterium]